MQIDWWTLAIQAVNFLVLVWLLTRFLYRPIKDVIAKRKALADSVLADAEAKKRDAEAERLRYREETERLARERRDVRTEAHEELDEERRNLLAEAQHEADALRQAARRSIAEERDATLTEIQAQIASLAVRLASDLLANANAGSANDAFLNQLVLKLQRMSPDERRRLEADLAKDGQVTIVTAATLTADEKANWTQRLRGEFTQVAEADFATDGTILGGAEIRFPHTVVKATWADQLQSAEEAMRSDAPAS